MEKYFLFFVLMFFFTGCYTQFAKRDLPGSSAAVLGREYYIPNAHNYPNYKKFSMLFRHWIYIQFEDIYILKENDTLKFAEPRPEYIFYPDGSLDWLYIRNNGYYTLEQGKWGLFEDDSSIIKIAGTTAGMSRILKLRKISKDTLIMEDPDKYRKPPYIVY